MLWMASFGREAARRLTLKPSYVQLPNFRTQVCSSKGKYSTSISHEDLYMAGGFHSTKPWWYIVALVARVTSKLPSALQVSFSENSGETGVTPRVILVHNILQVLLIFTWGFKAFHTFLDEDNICWCTSRNGKYAIPWTFQKNSWRVLTRCAVARRGDSAFQDIPARGVPEVKRQGRATLRRPGIWIYHSYGAEIRAGIPDGSSGLIYCGFDLLHDLQFYIFPCWGIDGAVASSDWSG